MFNVSKSWGEPSLERTLMKFSSQCIYIYFFYHFYVHNRKFNLYKSTMKEKLVISGWTFWDFSKTKVWTLNTDMENFFKVAYKKHQKIFNNWMKVARNRKTLEAIQQIRQWLMKAIVIVILILMFVLELFFVLLLNPWHSLNSS